MFPDILHESSNVAWFSQSSLQSLVTHTYLWQGLCCYDICSFLPLPSLFSPTSVCLYHFLFPQCFVLLSGVSSFTHIYPLFLCRLFQCLVHISINHRLPLLTSPQPVPTPASLLPFSSYCFTRKKQNRTLHSIWQVLTACLVSLRPWGFQLRLVLSSIPPPMSETQFSLVHVLMHPCPHPQALTVTSGDSLYTSGIPSPHSEEQT